LWVTFQELITIFFHVIFYSSYCKHVKATGTHRRFEQGLSKLGTVGKTERLIIHFNKLNWFTEIYLQTLSNARLLGYIQYHVCTHSLIQCVDRFRGDSPKVHWSEGPLVRRFVCPKVC
jgi:hypothetical protein